jgi:hypothetical protein
VRGARIRFVLEKGQSTRVPDRRYRRAGHGYIRRAPVSKNTADAKMSECFKPGFKDALFKQISAICQLLYTCQAAVLWGFSNASQSKKTQYTARAFFSTFTHIPG